MGCTVNSCCSCYFSDVIDNLRAAVGVVVASCIVLCVMAIALCTSWCGVNVFTKDDSDAEDDAFVVVVLQVVFVVVLGAVRIVRILRSCEVELESRV